MYQKPVVERFGSFRELTLIGCGSDGDSGIFGFLDGDIKACFERNS